jgi:hypothetical protein
MNTVMASRRRPPISSRLNVPQLRERLELLFRTARSPRIHTVSALDRKLGLTGQRSFRQYYRGDRPSGIPGELVTPFLKLFNLQLEELLLPLVALERLLESQAHGDPQKGWYSAEIHRPAQELTVAGEIRFSWPAWDLQLILVPCSPTSPLALLPDGEQRTRVQAGTPFHIELRQGGNSHPRMMGLLKSTDFVCFLEPDELPAGELRRRLPGPFSLEPGPCSLTLLLLGNGPVPADGLQKLREPDGRSRRLGAEAIYAAAREQGANPLVVLRADLEAMG